MAQQQKSSRGLVTVAKFFVRIFQVIPNLTWIFVAYLLFADSVDNELFWLWEIPVNTGMFLILIGFILLLIEIAKSTSFNARAIFELLLSIILAFVYYSFIKDGGECQTPTFLVLTFLQFMDVGAGVIIMVSVARRDYAIGALGG